ncbi:MAG: hypothetical protein ACKOQO_00680 [Candidatus Limnocylindrus sp.]
MNTAVAQARNGLHFEKLLLDVLNELKDRDARVVHESEHGTWIEIDGDGFPVMITQLQESVDLGTELVICRAPAYDDVKITAALYRWVATEGQRTSVVKTFLVPTVAEIRSGITHITADETRRKFGLVDHMWSVPTKNLTAELLATGILMVALSAATARRFLDGSGGGTPAFERLIADGSSEWPSTDDLLAMGAEFLDQ